MRPELGRINCDSRRQRTRKKFLGTGTLFGVYLTNRASSAPRAQLRTERAGRARASTGQIAGGRTRTGVFFTESIAYPFVGEVGQWAFIESFALREDLFRYAAPANASFTNASLPIQTRYAEVTLGRRLGTPGNLTVLGGGLSWEDIRFERFPSGVNCVGFDFSTNGGGFRTVRPSRPHVCPGRARI